MQKRLIPQTETMKTIYFFLVVLLLTSCGDNGKSIGKMNLFGSAEKHQNQSPKPEVEDERTKEERERDSIRIRNYVNLYKVVDSAVVIDPKQIGKIPFDTIKFNKAVAYSYDGSHERIRIVSLGDEEGYPSQTIDFQKALTQAQVNKILPLFAKRSTYDPMKSFGCFEPRFAIVLYNGREAVMQLSICLDCNNLGVNPDIKENRSGFSSKGRKEIIAFCRELGFPYGELEQ